MTCLGSSPGPSIGCLVCFVLTMLGRFLSSLIIGGSGGLDPASSWGEQGNVDEWRGKWVEVQCRNQYLQLGTAPNIFDVLIFGQLGNWASRMLEEALAAHSPLQ